MSFAPAYRSIITTARITAVFSAIVTAGLLLTFLAHPVALPLDEPEYLALKQQLETDPENSVLQDQIRDLDVQLRAAYFRRQTFRRRGAYLLALGVVSTLLLTHWAHTVRRRLPASKTINDKPPPEVRQNQLAQLAACGLIVLLASVVVTNHFASRSILRGSLAVTEAAASDPALTSSSGAGGPGPATSSAPQAARAESPQPDTTPLPAATSAQIARNWHRFRGPWGTGESPVSDVPETWDGVGGEGVLWKTPIPLPGVSSPIVWEQHIFLTGATEQRREVYCIDAQSGQLRWVRAVAESATDRADISVDKSTGYAAPTPTTDGQRVYAIFASGHLVAFDFDGNLIWSIDFGPLDNPYGHASSLATHGDTVIVQLDQGNLSDEKSRLLAIRGATGEIVWQTPRPVRASWSTPLVAELDGQARIVTCAEPWVIVYAADDGQELWRAECLEGDVGPSAVYGEGIVYVANDHSQAAAIRDGGRGDVTDSHIVWTADFSLPDICSPLLTEQHLLLVASFGALVSYDRQSGGEEPQWEEDLGGVLMASPSLVAGRVYLIDEKGKGMVVKAHESGVDRIAENDLGEPCFSSPAFQPGRIYIRGNQHLFCVGKL